jgi:hypothetical protein
MEYVAGITHCADCGRQLAERLPQPPPIGTPVTEVSVQTYPNWLEASVWAERLRAEGIPVVLSAIGPGVGRYGTDQLAPHELRVRSTDLERAREILPVADTHY